MAAQIFKALQKQDVSAVRRLISSYDSAVGCKDSQGRTPLHVAAQLSNVDCVRELLRAKASVDATDGQGNLALHIAAEQGSQDVVQELLTGSGRRATAKKKNHRGQTPLHLAAAAGNASVVATLLDAGARCDKDAAGCLPQDLVPPDSPTYPQILEMLNRASEGTTLSTPGIRRTPSHTQTQQSAPATPNGAAPDPASSVVVVSALLAGGASPAPPASPAAAAAPAAPAASTPVSRGAGSKLPSATPNSARSYRPQSASNTPTNILRHSMAKPSRIGSGGGSASTAGASAAGPHTPAQPSQTAILTADVQALQTKWQDLSECVDEFREAHEANVNARQDISEALMQSQELIRMQAERLEEMEARLAHVEQRNKDLVNRLERVDERQTQQAEWMRDQPATTNTLNASLRALTDQVRSLQATQQATQSALDALRRDMSATAATVAGAAALASTSKAASATGQADANGTNGGAPTSTPRDATGDSTAPQGGSSQAGLASELSELSAQVQALTSRSVTSGDLEGLKSRLVRLEALGVSDQLELLALRATQLSANLTTLTAAHQETGEKVAGLVRWQAKQAAAAAAATRRSADGAATSEVDGAAAGALRNNSGGFASMATNMVRVEVRLSELESLRKEEASALEHHKAAVDDIRGVLTTLQTQVADLATAAAAATSAPPTPAPITPSGSARRGAASAPPVGDSYEELQAAVGTLHRDVSCLKDGLDELRTNLNVVTGTLKREWDAAVAEAGRRAAESAAELSQKEARIKAMKEAMVAEGQIQATMAELEKRVSAALKGVDTRLDTLQHKVEVVQEHQATLMSS